MARPKVDDDVKKREGIALKSFFDRAQRQDKSTTVESLADEMDVTQGLVSQFFSGATRISDKRLIWLGKRLGFNPLEIRPDLAELIVDDDMKIPKMRIEATMTEGGSLQEAIKEFPSGQKELIELLAASRKNLGKKDLLRLKAIVRAYIDHS